MLVDLCVVKEGERCMKCDISGCLPDCDREHCIYILHKSDAFKMCIINEMLYKEVNY